jgi:putative ABC transport system substrate-binding protein
MTTRRMFIRTLAGGLLAAPLVAEAQQASKVHRIGLLAPSDAHAGTPYVEAFRQGLRELGWVEGNNCVIEYRWADGRLERLPALAADLVRLHVDVILTGAGSANQAAKEATKTIPIVMTTGVNPVESGLVVSLARPGGNITGLSGNAGPEIIGKEIELLREAVPDVSRVAVLWNPTNQGLSWREADVAAQALRLQLQKLQVRGPDDFETAFSAMTRGRAGALLIRGDVLFFVHRTRLVEFWTKSRMATMYGGPGAREFVNAGALIGHGPSLLDLFRRAAMYVDKIFKGTKPSDLPIEQPTKFEVAINMKTAKALGLTIPPSLLARADQVIE